MSWPHTIKPWVINKLGNFQWKDCYQDITRSVLVQVITTKESSPRDEPGGLALVHDTQMRVNCHFTQEAIEEFERIQCGFSGCEFSDLSKYLISLDRYRVIPILSLDLGECVFIMRVYSFSYIGPVRLRNGVKDTRMAHQHTRIFNKLKELRELWKDKRLAIVSENSESSSRSNEDDLTQMVEYIKEMERKQDENEDSAQNGEEDTIAPIRKELVTTGETGQKEKRQSEHRKHSKRDVRTVLGEGSLTATFAIELSLYKEMKCHHHSNCLQMRPLTPPLGGNDDPGDSLREVLDDLPVMLYTCIPDYANQEMPEGLRAWELDELEDGNAMASRQKEKSLVAMETSSTIRTCDSSSQQYEEGMEPLQWPPGSASLQDGLSSSCPASISPEKSHENRGRTLSVRSDRLQGKNAVEDAGDSRTHKDSSKEVTVADSSQNGDRSLVEDRGNKKGETTDHNHQRTGSSPSAVLVKDTQPNDSQVSSGSAGDERVVLETPEREESMEENDNAPAGTKGKSGSDQVEMQCTEEEDTTMSVCKKQNEPMDPEAPSQPISKQANAEMAAVQQDATSACDTHSGDQISGKANGVVRTDGSNETSSEEVVGSVSCGANPSRKASKERDELSRHLRVDDKSKSERQAERSSEANSAGNCEGDRETDANLKKMDKCLEMEDNEGLGIAMEMAKGHVVPEETDHQSLRTEGSESRDARTVDRTPTGTSSSSTGSTDSMVCGQLQATMDSLGAANETNISSDKCERDRSNGQLPEDGNMIPSLDSFSPPGGKDSSVSDMRYSGGDMNNVGQRSDRSGFGDDGMMETQPFEVDSPGGPSRSGAVQSRRGTAEGKNHDNSFPETQPFDVEVFVTQKAPRSTEKSEDSTVAESQPTAMAVQIPCQLTAKPDSQALTSDLPSSLLNNAFLQTQSQDPDKTAEVNTTRSSAMREPDSGSLEKSDKGHHITHESSTSSEEDIFSTCPCTSPSKAFVGNKDRHSSGNMSTSEPIEPWLIDSFDADSCLDDANIHKQQGRNSRKTVSADGDEGQREGAAQRSDLPNRTSLAKRKDSESSSSNIPSKSVTEEAYHSDAFEIVSGDGDEFVSLNHDGNNLRTVSIGGNGLQEQTSSKQEDAPPERYCAKDKAQDLLEVSCNSKTVDPKGVDMPENANCGSYKDGSTEQVKIPNDASSVDKTISKTRTQPNRLQQSNAMDTAPALPLRERTCAPRDAGTTEVGSSESDESVGTEQNSNSKRALSVENVGQGQNSSKRYRLDRTPRKRGKHEPFDLSLIFGTPVDVEEVNRLLDERYSPIREGSVKTNGEKKQSISKPSRKSLVSEFVAGLRGLKCSCGETLSEESGSSQCDSCQNSPSLFNTLPESLGTQKGSGETSRTPDGQSSTLRKSSKDAGGRRSQGITTNNRTSGSTMAASSRKRKLAKESVTTRKPENSKRRRMSREDVTGERIARKAKIIRKELLRMVINDHCKLKKSKR